jgi:dihydroorotate dehydrogenase (NAD+) catalytic subunit
MTDPPIDLSVRLGKLTLKNPVMPSSGTFGYGEEFADFVDLGSLGAVITKSISLHPRLGNFQHRSLEVAGCGYISTVGLQNIGVEAFLKHKLPRLRKYGTPIIVNIAGESTDEFVRVAEILNRAEGVSGLELNMTCPNTKKGGVMFSARPEMAFEVVKSVRNVTDLTVIAKGSTAADIVTLAKACEEAGADAFCPVYGVLGMVIDIHTGTSRLGRNLNGGVGSPVLKPVVVRLVWQVSRVLKIPVVGCRGITCAEDALEYLIAGATALKIGAYNFVDPAVTVKTIDGIRQFLIDKGISRVTDLIGTFKTS